MSCIEVFRFGDGVVDIHSADLADVRRPCPQCGLGMGRLETTSPHQGSGVANILYLAAPLAASG